MVYRYKWRPVVGALHITRARGDGARAGTQRGGIGGGTRNGMRVGSRNGLGSRGYTNGKEDSRVRKDDQRGKTAGGYSIRLSSSRPESRSTVISRPVSRMATTSRPGSRTMSAKQDMKSLAMRDF